MLRLDAVRQTIAMDTLSDGPAGGRWMTLAELAVARGTSKATAARLVRRHKWRRQPGNDGHVRVYVPEGKAEPRYEPREDSPAGGPAGGPASALAVIAAALSAQERAESRAEKAEARAEAIAAELAAERARAESLSATLAQREAELARRKRGFLARIRGAWRS